MANSRKLHLQFPLGGLDRRGAYRRQSPFCTPDACNVRPFATLEGRERGGSRPGLDLSHNDRLATGPVQMLENMNIAFGDGFAMWSDCFNGLSLASAWSTAAWASDSPGVLATMQSYVDEDLNTGAAVRTALDIDSSESYSVEMYIAPDSGGHHGKYQLFARMDDTTPNVTTEGVKAELVMSGTGGVFSGSLTAYMAGSPTVYNFAGGNDGEPLAGWFTMLITGDTVKCFWRGVEQVSQAVAAQTGLRVGFGMECTESGGICLVDTFRVQYYSETDAPSTRAVIIGAADGDLYREVFRGRMEKVVSDVTVRGDGLLHGVQIGQKLYIADHGLRIDGIDGTTAGTTFDATGVSDWTAHGIDTHSDVVVVSNAQGGAVDGTYQIASVAAGSVTLVSDAGTGTCTYRVERAPKIYDPITNELSILSASAGQVPSGNPLIARYRDRLVLAGSDIAPHVWYMARQGTPSDWDYAESDVQRAVAGTSSEAGVPGEPMTAMMPHSDDYLLVGCENSLWLMRGDPATGGVLDNLSHTVGMVDSGSWTLGPAAEIIFLTRDGVYMLPPGASSYPQPVSRNVLPQELVNINPSSTTVLMEYDVRDRGVHIYLTPDSTNERIHWWMDWERKTFWPVALQGDHEPTAICRLVASSAEDTGVILGGRDGWLRRYSAMNETDAGEDIDSYVYYGPIPLGNDYQEGKIMDLTGVLADDSGPVTWSVLPGETYEAAVVATAIDTGTWTEGLNFAARPGGRGQAFVMKLEGNGSRRWAIERALAAVRTVGKQRLL